MMRFLIRSGSLVLSIALLLGAVKRSAVAQAVSIPQIEQIGQVSSDKANTEKMQKARATELIQQSSTQIDAKNLQAKTQPCQRAATLLLSLEALLNESGENQSAIPKLANSKAKALMFATFAKSAESRTEYFSAIECYEEAVKLYHEGNDLRSEASTLLDLGFLFHSLSQPRESLEREKQALAIYIQLNDREGMNRVMLNIALTIDDAFPQQRQVAVALYQILLKNYQESKDRLGEANTLLNLGIVYKNLENYDQSIAADQAALPIFRELKNRNGEAKVLYSLGYTYRKLGQHSKALEFYQQALPIYQAVNDRN